jgi:SH3 domain protein
VANAKSDTVYIRDILYVPLRDGQSVEYRILHRAVRTGTKLERLESNKDTGYSRVRMSDGLEGWLQSQYLVKDPVARDLLVKVEQELGKLKNRHQQTLIELEEFTSREAYITESNTSLQSKNDALTDELNNLTALAANVIAIDEQNKQFIEEHDSLLNEIDALFVANQSFQDTSNQQWFLRGAGIILVGLLIGFWTSRKLYNKRSSTGWS